MAMLKFYAQSLAPAKINLYLHVTGKRADGYHLLDSLVMFAKAGDMLEVRIRQDSLITLTIQGPFAPLLSPEEVQTNSVYKAALLLQKHSGTTYGADIVLEKHLPVASGVGGGSSDAATTLILLAELWKLQVTQAELCALALPLGADMPMCVMRKKLWMSGIGEVLEPIDHSLTLFAVLVNPGIAVNTIQVFKKGAPIWSGGRNHDASVFASPSDLLAFLTHETANDLEAPAKTIAPVIDKVLHALRTQPDCKLARMSGSGATCFGLYETQEKADAAAKALAQYHPTWWIRSTMLS